ncbi:hypothetical protein HYH03_016415 [Edaphochlamys debaryana]|uniref:Glycosyltransferase n=1 Tax=Edaphochlamys debaryana TaxID=47281 RepID=A0A835XM67_9CHLO|nr:hypothetical protein HYH03_016415 [Edaphochlamys debaryana]|eukprot:KAG2484761.1 hypothetical protein HYH03_016415 [Edaphochlamys debaryana]
MADSGAQGAPPDGGGTPATSRPGLVVFARLPVPGRVKTRLAAGAGVGPDGACDFYRACAMHALTQAASCSPWLDAYVYHSSADRTADVAAWLDGEGLALPCSPQISAAAASSSGSAPQPEPDLGAKMLAAMRDTRQRGGHTKVLITGTDIPDLSESILRCAVDALDSHEMVIGPAMDGGYYLMGLTRLEESLFQDMAWSTDTVLAETLARARAAGLRLAPADMLPPLRDVDTVEDLAEWVVSCGPGSNQGASASARGTPEDAGYTGEHTGAPPEARQDKAVAGSEVGRGDEASRRRTQLLVVSKQLLARAGFAGDTAAAAPAGSE